MWVCLVFVVVVVFDGISLVSAAQFVSVVVDASVFDIMLGMFRLQAKHLKNMVSRWYSHRVQWYSLMKDCLWLKKKIIAF